LALGQFPNAAETTVPALILALKDDIAREAARALGELGPGARAAVPALLEACRSHSESDTRDAARQALLWIDPEALREA
jgi:HEAT repeat protein